MGLTDLAQDRDHWGTTANIVKDIHIPYNVGKFLSSCTTDSFSRTQLHEIN
jgi:hypothetical protein